MYEQATTGMHKLDVETPVLLLDMDAAERNIARMASYFQDKECKLRPHVKTHKLPLIAAKQIEAGAIGVTCAKLGEAEVFLQSGIRNVLIANQVVSDKKIRRMLELSELGDLIVCIDDYENAKHISDIARSMNRNMNVLVEVNVGINRCGIAPGEPTLDFVREISKLKNLNFRGLMGYEGGMFTNDPEEKVTKCSQCNRLLVETSELVRKDGFPVEIVSAGGSNTYYLTGEYPGITDVQVGSYVTMDSHNKSFGLDFEQAVTVLTTVISRPEKTRVIIDAGKKSISCDEGMSSFTRQGLTLHILNEEHGHVRIDNPDTDLSVGDKLEIIPSHGCTTIPIYDHYILIRNNHVESIEPIQARHAI